ncbi:MAG: hypothetical protein IJ464_01495 [Alistipes sp.]|nr:hypothetical protein [Alistipes sp.]
MENVQSSWSSVTQGIYKAVLLYVFAGIASALFGFIGTLTGVLGAMESGNVEDVVSFGFWDIMDLVASLAVVAGYILFYIGLNKWRTIADANDATAINKLRIAALLTMIGSVVAFVPAAGAVIAFILNIVAFILMLQGYSALKNSTTLPEGAREGARKLHTAMVLNIVAILTGWIPVIGWVAAPILQLIAFFKVLNGWKAIANS